MDWEPATKVQKNDAGEFRAMIGGEWVPVVKAQKSDSGEFRVMRQDAPVAAPESSVMDHVKNLAAGAVRGAGSIGATILAPADMLNDYLIGDREKSLSGLVTGQQPISRNQERRQQIDEGLQMMGADPSSWMYQGGKLGGEIAGTAGVGGALAKGAQALNAAPKVIAALESGGFSLGNAPKAATIAGKVADATIRAGSGAAVGGASAGIVDPESAGMGAAIGGAAYPAVKAAVMVGKTARNVAGTAITQALGLSTGAGAEAVKAAFKAGKDKSSTFLDNMTGNANMTDVLEEAKTALGKMRIERGAEYRNGMAKVSGDKTVLDFVPIMDEVTKVQNLGSFKGQAINKNAAGTVQELFDQVANWSKLAPNEFHTPEGLDALKKSIGDIRDATQFGTPARKAADQVYNAVKTQISKQAPEYDKVMRDYSDASDLITEIQKGLSLGEKTSADTAMRKLQSLMRNNVNTNYGNRLTLANELQAQGADILPAVAGQALSSWMPRGLMAPAGALASLSNPALMAGLPLASPRAVGTLAYGAGRAAAAPSDLAHLAAGRMQGLLGGAMPQLGGMPLSLLSTIPAVSLSR